MPAGGRRWKLLLYLSKTRRPAIGIAGILLFSPQTNRQRSNRPTAHLAGTPSGGVNQSRNELERTITRQLCNTVLRFDGLTAFLHDFSRYCSVHTQSRLDPGNNNNMQLPQSDIVHPSTCGCRHRLLPILRTLFLSKTANRCPPISAVLCIV